MGVGADVCEGVSMAYKLLTRTMEVCPDCGNKRCPRATDPALPCTGSNEPGQPGSRYTTPTPGAPEQ